MNKSDEDLPIIHTEPNPFWKKNAEKLVGESISTIEDVAKELIVVTSLLEGLYFHAIAFSDLRNSLNGPAWIYLAPIALWLTSLFFAIWTLSPKIYGININSTRSSKETFEEIATKKHTLLMVSEAFLIVSFLPLLVAVYYYLTYKPPA